MGQYVAGAILGHDFSARAALHHGNEWVKGKSYRSFGPTGPFLALLPLNRPAAARMLNSLQLHLWCNGELRQSDTTDTLITDVPTMLTVVTLRR